MRRPQQEGLAVSGKRVAVQAPIGGLNARDPVSAMKETDAIELENWFPRSSSVDLRKGFIQFADLPVAGHTLMCYNTAAGADVLFAACNDGIYDVTAGGVISGSPATPLSSPLSCQFTLISTAGGKFLWACNGVDKPKLYTGSAWVTLDSTSTPALTGISDTTKIVNVSLFKSRLIFSLKDSLSFWYLPVNSIAGVAVEFPLGALFRQGGYIVATASFTVDGGNGPDDRLAIITNKGEVAVYTGTDPSSASTWALTGIYQIPPPIGRKCIVRVEGDLAILTSLGVVPFSKAVLKSSSGTLTTITDKVSPLFNSLWQGGRGLEDWQLFIHSPETMMIVNIPLLSGDRHQLVLNTSTGAWCRFTGMPASGFENFNLGLYSIWGDKVYKNWEGYNDNGSSILARVRQAYTSLQSPHRLKHVKLLQLPLTISADIGLRLALDKDYESTLSISGLPSSARSDVARWDSAVWDVDRWVGVFVNTQWRKVSCQPGFMISLRSELNVKDTSVAWTITNYIYETGGIF